MPYKNADRQRLYRLQHKDQQRAYRRDWKEKSKGRLKPFVAIDSEGVSFGERVKIGDDFGRIQRTVFWGAAGVEGDAIWLNGKPYCRSYEILDWLITLPDHFGPAIFVWFGSSYDATQLFVDLPYNKAWELQHGKSYKSKGDGKKGVAGRYVLWGEYALSYIKQKCLKIARLKDRENPRDEKGKLRFDRSIIIYDVFGFFQTSFLKAAASIPGSMSDHERGIIEEGKAARAEFDLSNRATMQRYTTVELHVLARMMTALRDSLTKLDLQLTRWQGAGSIAAALLTTKKVKQHFYPTNSSDLELPQQWAHHAFFGGRIECLKQGRYEKTLYSHDVRSAYPFHMVDLPSMAGGTFEYVENPTMGQIRDANVVSMFKLCFECDVSDVPTMLNKIHGTDGPEFYPLPYRDKTGRITYPPRVRGVYMAEETRAAFEWLDYYTRYYATRARNPLVLPARIVVEAALLFRPATDQAPFEWLSDLYHERKAIVANNEKTGVYDLTEKVIKLGINSCYGKTAQSVGSADKPPGTASPWYAAAITAGTRAQLLRAAITRPPGSIVAFQTDGIVTTRKPLAVQEGGDLGLWEINKIEGRSYFVQPGIYHLGKSSKHRGIKLDLLGTDKFRDWLDQHLPDAWTRGVETIDYGYRYYVTLGAAVASEERWKFAGYWVDGTRQLQTDNLGVKRAAPIFRDEKKSRATGLVDTIPKPAFYHDGDMDDFPMSEPHRPDWLDGDFGLTVEIEMLNEEIAIARG